MAAGVGMCVRFLLSISNFKESRLFIWRQSQFKITLLLALIIVSLPSGVHAAFGFKLDGTLDKEAISHAYFEGEFGRVLPPLETYRQSFPGNATKEDSIFVYKYLSVIYAADSTTRQKAESYMVQLLKIMPTIELIDLYISDNIEAIFKNVKQSYQQQQDYVHGHDAYGRTKKEPAATGKLKITSSKQWLLWTVAGVGLTTAVVGTYYAFDQVSTPGKKHVLAD
jgi:hypothetical protein